MTLAELHQRRKDAEIMEKAHIETNHHGIASYWKGYKDACSMIINNFEIKENGD